MEPAIFAGNQSTNMKRRAITAMNGVKIKCYMQMCIRDRADGWFEVSRRTTKSRDCREGRKMCIRDRDNSSSSIAAACDFEWPSEDGEGVFVSRGCPPAK